MDYILSCLFLFLFYIVPFILTLCNILLLFSEKRVSKRAAGILDGCIFVLGISFTVLLWFVCEFAEWNTAIYNVRWNAYSPISFASMPTFLTLGTVALAGYALPRIRGTHLPPLVGALCYAGMFLGFVLTAVWFVQLAKNLDFPFFFFLLFPFNYVLCCIRLMRSLTREYSRKISETEYKNPVLRLCASLLKRSSGFLLGSFVLAVPLFLLVTAVLLLFGQKPDSAVRAFTDTAEWTLSQKIPPPRLDWDGHYLCTVAACGHEKTVKPLRAGKRHGQLIVVNRLLLVANAFEELIAEKTPRLHRMIRRIYDRFGLPVSRYITTKRRSDAVYLLMKPLEWLFTAVLYTFDEKPENRIALQYTK